MEEPLPRTVSRRLGWRCLVASVTLVVGPGCHGLHAGPRTLVGAGFACVAIGLAAVVAAGGWMATSVACQGDPDCADEEQCREIPAPPGGIPYKQCIPR